jgi:hypothetical protein
MRGSKGEGSVTEIIDRRQRAVMRVSATGPASPGERTVGRRRPGAPQRQKASHGNRRQRADARSRVSPLNTVLRSGTIAPPHCRGATDSHCSGSCHRWDGHCSQRRSRWDAVWTNERAVGDATSRWASASWCTREILRGQAAASATPSTPTSGFLPTIGCASSDAVAISYVPRSPPTIAPCPPVARRHGCTAAEASATLASRERHAPRRVNGYGCGTVRSGAPGCPRQVPPVRPSSPQGAPPTAG